MKTFDEDDNNEIDDMEKDSNEKKDTGKNILREIVEFSCYLLAVLIVTLLITTFIGQRTIVDGSSMNPTLYDKDNLIIDKISYRFKEPERFDIIVFPYEQKKHVYYIKRIIGLPGETIQISEDGDIYINEELLEEHYGAEVIKNPGLAKDPITLGDDEYFVMGDNRNNSSDSRYFDVGNIKRKNIIGKTWLRIFPFNQFGLIKHK